MTMIRNATIALVEENLRFGAFYHGALANHLPMALVALDAMGADDEATRRFAARYAAKLEPLPPARFVIAPGREMDFIAPGREMDFIGRVEAFPEWVEYFDREILEQGAQPVLRAWIDTLATGIAGGAFHGAIRTAYAIASRSERELAHALASWSAAHGTLRSAPAPTGTEAVADVLASLAADPDFAGRRAEGKLIADRTRRAAAAPGFAALAARADPARLELDALAGAFIRAYAASGNFTLLHGVTACCAFRDLAPFASRPDIALRHLWQALLAAFIGSGSPSVQGWVLKGERVLPWVDILRGAALCLDEHDVKIAHTCWREFQRTGDDLYRTVASARVSEALREATA